MGVLDILQELQLEGYDPTDDVISEFENLEDGTYEGFISDFSFKQNDKGTEWFSFEITVPTEDNRKHWANLFLSGKMAKVNLKKTLNYIYKLSGTIMEATDFADMEVGVEQAKQLIMGVFVLLTLKTNAKGYQSFEMEKVEQ